MTVSVKAALNIGIKNEKGGMYCEREHCKVACLDDGDGEEADAIAKLGVQFTQIHGFLVKVSYWEGDEYDGL